MFQLSIYWLSVPNLSFTTSSAKMEMGPLNSFLLPPGTVVSVVSRGRYRDIAEGRDFPSLCSLSRLLQLVASLEPSSAVLWLAFIFGYWTVSYDSRSLWALNSLIHFNYNANIWILTQKLRCKSVITVLWYKNVKGLMVFQTINTSGLWPTDLLEMKIPWPYLLPWSNKVRPRSMRTYRLLEWHLFRMWEVLIGPGILFFSPSRSGEVGRWQ